MIEVNNVDHFRRCNCCASDVDVIEVSFRSDYMNQGTTVALCRKCATNLNTILSQRYGEEDQA